MSEFASFVFSLLVIFDLFKSIKRKALCQQINVTLKEIEHSLSKGFVGSGLYLAFEALTSCHLKMLLAYLQYFRGNLFTESNVWSKLNN